MVLADYNDKTYDYTKYWQGRDYESQAEFTALKKLLPRDFKEDRSIIDVGGGFGRLVPLFRSYFGDITIFDYSQKLLDKAKEDAESSGLKISTILGDINNISGLVNRKYDYVSMVRVSHHLSDLDYVFKEIEKILSSDGVFILEIANKMHFKSVVLNFLKGNLNYFRLDSISIATKDVTFLNHHPKYVEKLLKENGFNIVKKLSVSNLRSSLFKKFLPLGFLIKVESVLQSVLSSVYFGPSIFYKIEKVQK